MKKEIIFYPDDHVKHMYLYFRDLMKHRYVLAADSQAGVTVPLITWAHISYWRKELCRWGGIMISRDFLDVEEYVLSKREYTEIRSTGETINVIEVREAIELHPDFLKNN